MRSGFAVHIAATVVALTIPGVFATHPFSRSLWLAIDLLFRPAERNDFTPDERPAQ